MKRVIALMLALAMSFCMLPTSALATDETQHVTFSLSADNANIKTGDIRTVTVSINADDRMTAVGFQLSIPSTTLEYMTGSFKTKTNADYGTIHFNESKYILTCYGADTSAMEFEFKVKMKDFEYTEGGTTQIKILENQKLTAAYVGAKTITISNTTYEKQIDQIDYVLNGSLPVLSFKYYKETPIYTTPTGLEATCGQTLADVTLPGGFSWISPTTTSVGTQGLKQFEVKFTTGSNKYRVVTGINVLIKVEHNLIYSSDRNVVTEICNKACGYSETAKLVLTTSTDYLVYNGNEIKPYTIEYSSGWQGDKAAVIIYESNTDAGMATAKATIEGKAVTADFEIKKATFSIGPTIPEPYYDGLPHTITMNATIDGVTYSYRTNTNTEYVSEIPTFVDAGTYTIYYKGTKANYNDVEGSAEITIRKDINDINAVTISDWTYGDEPIMPIADCKYGLPIIKIYSDENHTNEVTLTSKTDAGSYYVRITSPASNNYTSETNDNVLEIAKKSVAAPSVESKEFTSNKQTADITSNDIYTVTTNNGGMLVGSYDVVLSLNNTNNYKWATSDEASITIKFNITACEHTYASNYSYDSIYHWYECTKCGTKKDVHEHTFESSTDVDCTCGYTRTIVTPPSLVNNTYTVNSITADELKNTGTDLTAVFSQAKTDKASEQTPTNKVIEIQAGSSSITFDDAAVTQIANSGKNSIAMKVEVTTSTEINKTASQNIETANTSGKLNKDTVKVVVEVSLNTTFENGKATIKIPVPALSAGQAYHIVYVKTDGTTEEIKNYTYESGYIIFTVNHFSTYVAATHTLEYVPAVAATYSSTGNIAYYKCTDAGCNKYFSDSEGKNEMAVNSWVTAMLTRPSSSGGSGRGGSGGGSSGGSKVSTADVVSTVNITDYVGGTITISDPSAKYGTVITITVTPDEGYGLKGLRVNGIDGTIIDYIQSNEDINVFTFSMPNQDVKIEADFVEIAAQYIPVEELEEIITSDEEEIETETEETEVVSEQIEPTPVKKRTWIDDLNDFFNRLGKIFANMFKSKK